MYRFCRALGAFWLKVFKRYELIGKENIPSEGSAVICANHIHLFDPLAIGIATKRIVTFMAKSDLYKKKIGKWFFTKLRTIPVNRDGNDLYSMKKALEVIKGGELLGIFPEGTREKGTVLPFKAGAAMMALRTATPVIPVYIEGDYRIFRRVTVVIGERLDMSEYEGRKLSTEDYERIALEVIQPAVFALKEKI